MDLDKIERFIRKTHRSFTPVAEQFGRPGDKGGFIYIGRLGHGDMSVPAPIHHGFVARPDAKRFSNFRHFSEEKVLRLETRYWREGHVLSSQSRDDEKEKYAGAVKAPDAEYFSFSGLPQMTDEAYVTANLVCADLMTMDKALEYMGISGNTTHFNEVYRVVRLASSDA